MNPITRIKAGINKMFTRAKDSNPDYRTLPSITTYVSEDEIREHTRAQTELERRLERVSAIARVYSRER